MISRQEAFDLVWRWFVVERHGPSVVYQKAKVDLSSGTCRYRTDDGVGRCGIGVLIPDSAYDPEMEFKSVDKLREGFPAVNQYLPVDPGDGRDFANGLQRSHDYAAIPAGTWGEPPTAEAFTYSIECNLRLLADEFDLTIPGPTAETGGSSC